MLNKIIDFSIRNKLIVGLMMLVLVIYGSYELTRLPIDAVPDITDNQVQIITVSPALGAPDVERLITFPIEQANSNIPGLKEIRSFSRFGLSVVTIVFEDAVDVYWARQQVSERLIDAQAQIPQAFGTPMLAPVTTGLGEIYQYVVRAKEGYEDRYDPMQLRTIQDWMVRRQLLGVKGVADVSSFGGYLKQYEIAVNPARLKSYNISINDVFAALENNNQNTGGAYIEKTSTVLFIRSEGLVGSLKDIENIVVKQTAKGTPLLIRDVADVQLGHATRYGALSYNGEREVSGAVVMMLKGANSNEVIGNIKTRIAAIQKTLPEGVVIEAFLDRTKMVNHAIGTVKQNLLEGAVIVLLVLVLFLGNIRAGLLVASIIPFSMLIAVILMNLFGVSGNLMSLGALDFGLMVDGAIIIVEAVMHHIRAHQLSSLSRPEMDHTVSSVAARMRNAAVFGEIIIVVVYIPIFTLRGIEGKMFLPMAQTVAFALFGAFILSLTYIPMMTSLVLRKSFTAKPSFSDRWIGLLEERYVQFLKRLIRIPKTILALIALLFAGALITLANMGGEFMPSLEEGDFAVETRLMTGSNLKASLEVVAQSSKILLEKFPEVEKVVGKTGSGEIPTDPMPLEASDLMIILKDKSEWTSASTFPELAEKMSAALKAVPGVNFGFQYPVQMRFNELMTGSRQDVVCKIFGEDMDTLSVYAKQLGDVVKTVSGTRDVYVESVNGMPQIVIHYNRAAIAQYGLSVSVINKIVNTAFAGQSTGWVYEGEKRFDMVVRLQGEQRKNIEDVQNLLIPLTDGNQIPLYQVADIEVRDGINQIQREDAHRRIVVGFNVRGRDVQSIIEELQKKVEVQLKLPAGYSIRYGGAFENLAAAKSRLAIAVPVSLLLIFLLLFFAFHSLRQGLLIYTAIPLSAIGGIYALALRGMPFSISAGVGFIALFGVAVLNGIVLIAEFNRLKKEGMTDLLGIILQGARTRLRPVLMTALVASLGFLPMAISHGAGAEVQRPLATVVIGGLLIATFLTLFVLPILYLLFEKKIKPALPGKTLSLLFLAGILTVCGTQLRAQTPIGLQAAIDTAMKNNLVLRSEKLSADYLRALEKSGADLPQTLVTGEYGQINSWYKDTRFGVSQSLKFPTVYARQKSVLNQESKSGPLNVALKAYELKREVTSAYFQLLYLQNKQSLLRRMDSIYAQFLSKAELRLNKGESNVLEKITAETQRGQVSQQLLQVQQDQAIALLQFQFLLNSDKNFVTLPEAPQLPEIAVMDTNGLQNHPFIAQLRQQQVINHARYRLERSRLLPDLFVSYNNMSMRGTGADERLYTGSTRFQSVQAGIGIPLFFGAQRSKITAMKLNQQIADNNYRSGLQQLQTEYERAYLLYQKYLQTVRYYESTALKNAELILVTADRQFNNGEINYLEWAMLVNQSASLQNDYIEVLNQLHQSIIQLNAFNTK